MKNFLLLTVLTTLAFAGCKTSQMTSTTDDVYANPAEERAIAKAAAEQKAREQAIQRQRDEEARAQQAAIDKEKQETAARYYKDPEYNSDDYYDYEYAARINRFHRPVYGAGFYDPYYTNLYTYNNNPAFWGTSIYSSYSWGMPSGQFNYYSMGVSTGWGYNSMWNNCAYNYYDPFCSYYSPWGPSYNSWGYNNWMASNAYYNGYNQGYYNGMNNASYGYYNKMDPNSNYGKATYAPRGSNIGNNISTGRGNNESERESLSSERQRYMQSVSEEQSKQPRFTGSTGDRRIDNGARRTESDESGRSSGTVTNPNRNSAPANTNQQGNDRRSDSKRVEQQPSRRENSNQNTSERNSGTINPAPSNNNGGGRNSSGGGNSPRGSSTGGNSKPR